MAFLQQLLARFTENTETKPAIFTTELWLGLATALGLNTDVIPLPDKYQGWATAGIVIAYLLSRGLAKKGEPHYGPKPAELRGGTIDEAELEATDTEPPGSPILTDPPLRRA